MKKIKKKEFDEIVEILAKVRIHIEENSEGVSNYSDWYAGITGQPQIQESVQKLDMVNEISKRMPGHKAKFKNLDQTSWGEWSVSSMKVAIEIEKHLHAEGFLGGASGPGNLSLNPKIVYVFKHGEKGI